MAKPSTLLAALSLSLLLVAIAAGGAAAPHADTAPAHAQHAEITHATAQKKLAELKAHHQTLKSQALQANGTKTGEGGEAKEADDGPAVAEGVAEGVDDRKDEKADDAEQDAKSGFWKKIIGGNSMVPGQENTHPDKHVPTLVWVLPVVAFIGVGLAITAYCMLAT